MSDLKKKLQTRNGHRSFVKKVMNNVHDLLDDGSNECRPKLESFKIALEKQQKDLELLDNQIAELLDADAIEKEVFEKCDFDIAVQESICSITAYLNASGVTNPISQVEQSQPDQNNTSTNSKQLQGHSSSSKSVNKTRLPKLSLPRFNGDPTKWIAFWDSFASAIHDNDDLNDVDKFQYLKSLMDGSATNALSGLPLTSANYKEAVALLRERFGNKQVIISKHMEILMQLPVVNDDDDLKKLRQLYDKTEATVRSLNGIGISADTYGTFLTPTIMAKIPKDLRLILSRKLSDEWDLDSLLKSFREELQLREKCALGSMVKEKKNEPIFNRKQPTTSGSFHTSSDKSTKNSPPEKENGTVWCTFCKGNHKSVSCSVVTEPEARRSILRRKGKCFVCLQSGHISRNCVNQRNCFRCGARHHTSICSARENPPPKPKQEEESQKKQTVSTNLYFTRNPNDQRQRVLLQTARAKVHSPDNESASCKTRMLFDSCSQKSYISARLRKKLNLQSIGSDTVMIKTFGKEQASVKKCDVLQLAVECVDNLKVYINAYEIDLICSPLSNQSIDIAQQNYPHLRELQLADVSTSTGESLEIDVMIGADFYWYFVQDNVVRGESNAGPVAMRTRLGYVLSGPLDLPENIEVTSNLSSVHAMETECFTPDPVTTDPVTPDSALKEELGKFWDYDTLGIKDGETDMYEEYLKTIKQNKCRYEVSLPFKKEHPVIPDNYLTAHTRLNSLVRRLKSSPEVLHEYDRVIKEQLNSGVIEEVKREEEKNVTPGTVHYIPHREVVRDDKSTTKLRVVYDASSRQGQEVSLNECLLPGPSLIPLIFDILLRFRLRKIALVGDLEKAFLNVEITPEQRDLLRFLWVDDLESKSPKEIVLRFTRLMFGLVCSPFILNAVLRNHLTKYQVADPQFVLDVIKSLYVDDYASGRESVQESFNLYQKLKGCFKEGGFNMRKWSTNSKELSEKIIEKETYLSAAEAKSQDPKNVLHSHVVEEDEGYSKTTLNNAVCTDDEIKVMGVVWARNSDTLKFKFSDLVNHAKNKPITKRLILSTAARFYDPLGLLSPVTVVLKTLFQELWRTEVDWDAPLSEKHDKQVKLWKEVIKDMEETSVIETPRCVLQDVNTVKVKSVELHGFADASNVAYGANVYLRVESSTGIVVQLMTSKTRVAPLKKETTPRLELLAALTLAKLMKSVSDSLDGVVRIDEIICWIDSQVVLWWIRGKGKQYKQFVQNRVSQIRSLWPEEFWRYCPTDLNPSDIASRGAKCSELASNCLWWNGPQFLMEDRAKWPAIIACPVTDVSAAEEVKREERSSTILNTFVSENLRPSRIGNIVPCERFSSLDKLLRVTALVRRFIENIRNRDHRVHQLDLTLAEINVAKILWHKDAQLHLEESKQVKESLGVFQDEDGVHRCKGRIQNSSLPHSTKFPVLLPRKHHYTRLVILRCHEIVKHNGIRETLTELRMNYWIVKGRQAVKSLISRCVVCKKLSGKAYQGQSTPPLPDFRVAEDPAFSGIGIDFAGPLYVKDIYQGYQMYKSYIAVFTCASSRAIHLELVPDLTANSFLRAFKRFIGRRGLPSVVISDNGKTFHDAKVKSFSIQRNISWKFNVPTASWWGGFFEICVKLVKKSLKKVTGNAKLSYEELETILVEIEGVLNSRPLTYVYDELTDPPLTPSCLVIGRRVLQQPPPWKSTEKSTSRTLGKRACHLEQILEHFRDRWRKEYLTGIREYQKLKINEPVRSIRVGDMIHIQQDKVPRLQWRLGKVTKLYPGKDGIVRAAEVATLDPSKHIVHIRRPLQKLYPLEVRSEEGNQQAKLNSEVKITPVTDESIPLLVVRK